MDDNTTFGEMVETGIDTVVEQVAKRVNLPPETETLLEAALHQAAHHGIDVARKLAQALRERIDQDSV